MKIQKQFFFFFGGGVGSGGQIWGGGVSGWMGTEN